MKRLLRKLLLPAPKFESRDYAMVKNERHVFAFGVWGRTSTTAFQRIMNSTRELCIWGEPGEFLVDNFMDAYVHIQARMAAADAEDQVRAVPSTFRRNSHTMETAMARADWSGSRRQLEQAFVDLLLPAIPTQRLGFKEIRIRSPRTFAGLRQMFPHCQFVFLFRNPVAQWASVQTMTSWQEARSIELFMSRVEELGEWYLAQDGVFVEDQHLRSVPHLNLLASHLGVSNYDSALVNDGIFAAKNKPPVPEPEQELLNQRLGGLYRRMQERSAEFFGHAP